MINMLLEFALYVMCLMIIILCISFVVLARRLQREDELRK